VIQLIVLCASVAALLILVPRYGGIGAAVSLLGAGALRLLLLLGAMRGILKLPLPRIYPNRDDLHYVMERLR
jgi:O-antigen/teichoic acid export membrane protein